MSDVAFRRSRVSRSAGHSLRALNCDNLARRRLGVLKVTTEAFGALSLLTSACQLWNINAKAARAAGRGNLSNRWRSCVMVIFAHMSTDPGREGFSSRNHWNCVSLMVESIVFIWCTNGNSPVLPMLFDGVSCLNYPSSVVNVCRRIARVVFW